MGRELHTIDTIVVHCADTHNGRHTTAGEIDAWHRERGFARGEAARALHQPALHHVGYHRLIYVTGVVVEGRALDEIGAHVESHNQTSVGICLMGTDAYTLAQWAALRVEIHKVCLAVQADGGAIKKICGHCDFPGVTKTCPGFDVSAFMKRGGYPPSPAHLLAG